MTRQNNDLGFDPNDDSSWTSVTEGEWTPETASQVKKPNQVYRNRKGIREANKREDKPLPLRILTWLLKPIIFMVVAIAAIIVINLMLESGTLDGDAIANVLSDFLP